MRAKCFPSSGPAWFTIDCTVDGNDITFASQQESSELRAGDKVRFGSTSCKIFSVTRDQDLVRLTIGEVRDE
jgi:hypothetical protein